MDNLINCTLQLVREVGRETGGWPINLASLTTQPVSWSSIHPKSSNVHVKTAARTCHYFHRHRMEHSLNHEQVLSTTKGGISHCPGQHPCVSHSLSAHTIQKLQLNKNTLNQNSWRYSALLRGSGRCKYTWLVWRSCFETIRFGVHEHNNHTQVCDLTCRLTLPRKGGPSPLASSFWCG